MCCITVTVLALQWYRKKLSASLLSLLQSTAGAFFCSLARRVGLSLYLFPNCSQSLFSHAGVCSGMVTSASFPQPAPCCPLSICVSLPHFCHPELTDPPKGHGWTFFLFLSWNCFFKLLLHSLCNCFTVSCSKFCIPMQYICFPLQSFCLVD